MKNVAKFSPKKEKHHNRYPFILDFDYSEITERLGVVLSDETLSIIHVPNLLTKTEAEFDAYIMNEVVFSLPEKMNKIFFVQMMNKWLTVSE
jgi:urate oxidase